MGICVGSRLGILKELPRL